MESPEKQQTPPKSSNYGEYAGYNAPYGYGYGTGEGGAGQRTFQDYVLILRERAWYIVAVFLVVFSTALIVTLSQTKIYQSTASVQVFRRDPVIMQTQAVMDNEVRSAEDLNTQVKVLESEAIVQKVADRLTGNDLAMFKAPYEREGAMGKVPITAILKRNRKVVPQRLSLMIDVQYDHPDPVVAAKVANLFADEYIAYNARVRIDESMKAVEDLKVRAEEQRKKVDEIALKLQAYREKNNLVSLDERKDIVTEKLKALNLLLTQSASKLAEAQVRWQQVKERMDAGKSLLDLPYISGQQSATATSTSLVSQLNQQLAEQEISISQLRERYRDKHPVMIAALNSLAQTKAQLQRAISDAASAVKANYQTAESDYQHARAALATQEAESLELDRYGVEYSNLERDYNINDQLLQHILGRMRETSMTSTIETQNARIVDRGLVASKPISPNVPLNLGLGLVGGLGLGLAFAFFVAYIDDRVKSSYDIESVVGLPLIGIIPEIKKMEGPDKAQIVVNNADRQVAEAFLTLHSSLRLKDESKNAKIFLTTSTIPGEGKSFMTTNIALTFAAHGEKVLVIDCDLRKPNIHKSFRLENLKGVIDVVTGTAKADDVIVRNVYPNFDVMTTGGRAKNPTQILNSKNFELMLSDLKKRYDRIFIDTPPLAAVSDAMIILPLCDGSLFTIFFNKVRRKAAQFVAHRLTDANVPNFGAILNGLNLAVSGYYYAQYYDKTYKDYYVVMAKQDPESPDR